MSGRVDVLIVGAGPAGMSAAIRLRAGGWTVAVVDDRPDPGGQIWRNVEAAAAAGRAAILGPSYASGRDLVARFRASGADYHPSTEVWRIEPGWRVSCRGDEGCRIIQAEHLVLAGGAQERPAPFPGWTLPGVLTVGAAQTLLKSTGDIPAEPVWIAGSGPLPLLYMQQLIAAGGKIAGYLNTAPMHNALRGLRHLPGALAGWRDLAQGAAWIAALRRRRIPTARIRALEAFGADRLEGIRYVTLTGRTVSAAASVLLVHEGLTPALHMALGLGCRVTWDEGQACFVPRVDPWGATDVDRLYLAGDMAGIAGAKAAALSGTIAAIGIDAKLRGLPVDRAEEEAGPFMMARARERAVRPLLDALYRPRPGLFAPPDHTVICRCEEVTAGEIRAASAIAAAGHNAVKGRTRAGMGACQGRQCAQMVSILLSEQTGAPVESLGLPNVRPPLKPVTLGEMAAMATIEADCREPPWT